MRRLLAADDAAHDLRLEGVGDRCRCAFELLGDRLREELRLALDQAAEDSSRRREGELDVLDRWRSDRGDLDAARDGCSRVRDHDVAREIGVDLADERADALADRDRETLDAT